MTHFLSTCAVSGCVCSPWPVLLSECTLLICCQPFLFSLFAARLIFLWLLSFNHASSTAHPLLFKRSLSSLQVLILYASPDYSRLSLLVNCSLSSLQLLPLYASFYSLYSLYSLSTLQLLTLHSSPAHSPLFSRSISSLQLLTLHSSHFVLFACAFSTF